MVKRGANCTYRRNIRRKHASLTPRAMFGDQRIHDRPQINCGALSLSKGGMLSLSKRGALSLSKGGAHALACDALSLSK